ncbi:MAG: N-formylglutamate amidohydrolase, partial [Verrucomicrobiae bacterium]|nr:N-formylglutamate amidohydrolase [Verrucomicrobiae bacterium]
MMASLNLRSGLGFLVAVITLSAGSGSVSLAQDKEGKEIPADWITVQSGSLPIVLGASHGGQLKPEELPNRKEGVLLRDAETDDMALRLSAELERRYGAKPFLVVCRVHRSKVDCNREIAEAAQGNPAAEALWRAFHRSISEACEVVREKWGTGVYFDLHGQNHPLARIELGYRLKAGDLAKSDEELDVAVSLREASSFRHLAERSELSFSAL